MLVCRGLGILVPLICLTVALTVERTTNIFFNDPTLFWTQPWGILWTGIISAILIFGLANICDIRVKNTSVPESGDERYFPKSVDNFFFIRVVWWAPIVLVAGVVLAFAGLG